MALIDICNGTSPSRSSGWRWLVTGTLLFQATNSWASSDSARSLLERHINARGGRNALEHLQVVERQGSFVYHGTEPPAHGSYHTCLGYPDRVAIDIDAGPVQIHQVLGDHGALNCDATFMHCEVAPADDANELQLTARQANREELTEDIPDQTAEIIYEDGQPAGYRFSNHDQPVEVEFAPDTGLELRKQKGSRERRYGHWAKVGDVLLPMQIEEYDAGVNTVSIALSAATSTTLPSEWCRARFSSTRTINPK